MKIAILSTCYLEQIKILYQNHYQLKDLHYEDEFEGLLKYSASQFYYWKKYIKRSGLDIEIFCHDLIWLNQKWAQEQKSSQLKELSSNELFLQRIKLFKPDILFVFSPIYYSEMIKKIKSDVSSVKKTVAWYGARQGNERETFNSYDLTLTNSKVFRQRLHATGMNAEILQHSFEPNTYDVISHSRKNLPKERKNRIMFTGTLGFENPDHLSRTVYLEKLAKSVDVDLFSDGAVYQKTKKQILLETRFFISSALSSSLGNLAPNKLKMWADKQNLPKFPKSSTKAFAQSLKGAVYGRDMLDKLSEYQVCFNFHNDATGDSACNMRMFEATGMGCCLLTDHKSDINSLFEPDTEIFTYKNSDEAISKATYLINNPKIARKIALAGQQKTHSEYTTEKQVQQLIFHLRNLWN